MPDLSFLSMAGAKKEAEDTVTLLANSVLHLYKAGFNPTVNTPLSDFTEQECDFDGYAPLTIATWHAPVLAGAAWLIYAPTQTFLWAHVAADVPNQAGGSYLVTAGGDLYSYTTFDPTRPVQGPGQAVITQPSDLFPAG